MALNSGWSYREQVGVEAAGRTVLAYLCDTRAHSPALEWADRLARGEVDLDGVPARADDLLRPGQLLVWHRPPWDEPDVPLSYDVLHEDEALLAVAKPSGLPTLPAGGFLCHTLLAVVRQRYADARPLHRLGRHTSGIVVFARTRESAAGLARRWRDRDVEKHYRALGAGVAGWDERDIDVPIGPVAHPRLGTVHGASAAGRAAHSVVRVIERRANATLCAVRIVTGRPHQVRIHLAWAGCPLAGDPLYAAGGLPREHAPGLPGDGGYLLHAERLAFVHPLTGRRIELASPPPPPLRSGRER